MRELHAQCVKILRAAAFCFLRNSIFPAVFQKVSFGIVSAKEISRKYVDSLCNSDRVRQLPLERNQNLMNV